MPPADTPGPAAALRDAACAVCGAPLFGQAGGLLSLSCPNGHPLAAALGEAAARDGAPEPEYARAPIRTLAPGIEQSDDTCDGRPRIAGTRLRTDVLKGHWLGRVACGDNPETAMRRVAAELGTTPGIVQHALIFQAGRAWERERRAARKRRRLAKRSREGRDAANGASDDR